MEIRHYLQILERRKWIVIIATAVTVTVIGAASLLMTPVYSASAIVRIAQIQDREIVGYYDLNYAERLMNTYVHLMKSRPFLQGVIERVGLNISPKDLVKVIEVEALTNTELLAITVESIDPEQAAEIANALAALLLEQKEKLYSGSGKSAQDVRLDQLALVESSLRADRERLQLLLGKTDGEDHSGEIEDLNTRIYVGEQTYSTVLDAYEKARLADEARANSISVVEPGVIPDSPSQPKIMFNLVVGTIVGLAGGIGLAFVFENLDSAIYSAEELESGTKVALLGSIPDIKVPSKLRKMPLLLQQNGRSSAGEAFRLLGSNILSLESGWAPRTLLVTSVEAGAGKSTVLANLAATLAQSGQNVVAVDSDFRDPCLDRIFGVSNNLGLKNIIVQKGELGLALQKTNIPRVSVLTSGPLSHNPAELLGLPKTREVIGDLANWADIVLLDSPPLLHFADAVMLAPLVDGVLLVVARGKVSGGRLEKAVEQLSKIGVKQVGFVFNRASTSEGLPALLTQR